MRVDIGGGLLVRDGYTNLDPVHGAGEWRRLAQDVPWPVGDGAVESVRASHVLEHIPAGAERIAVMNEAWRVLRPGGRFHIWVPRFPAWQAIADPTHVSFWMPQSFDYFTKPIANADYGIHFWDLVEMRDGEELFVVLEKP